MRPMPYTLAPPPPDLSRPPVKDGIVDWDAWRELEAADRQQFWYRESKRLTDAECAAEYWRAKADLATIEAVLVSPAAMNARVRVWHRFATHPHAEEVNQ